jgi:selenocysteine lyase/cysteine desulfurase
MIRDAVSGTEDDLVIFTGSGATAAVNKLIGILELRIPAGLDERYQLGAQIPEAERPMVFVGPYEHHSNELPWRESIADVVVIGEDSDGHIDLADLEGQLVRYGQRPLLIGSFSAASNVTGILTDTSAVAALLHAHGALSLWDYAAAGPYVPIRVSASRPDRDDHKDAIFLSPHKFPGGPQTPGVLVVRRELVRNQVPTVPGGGTVAFVDPVGHRYLDDPVAREEGGTPAIIESIRAGLVVGLKQAVGTDLIAAREEPLWRHVLRRWADIPGIEILGSSQASRLSIVSFRIRHGADFLHHNFVVAVLNDLFGIQARGGCSCAGPYGHRLLAIGAARSHALRDEIGHGCEGVKPGWSRVNLNYFISAAQADYIAAAVELIAADGYRLLPQYRFDPHTGLWRHASGPPRPQITLTDVTYGPDGTMSYPRERGSAGENAFPGYLRQARALLAALPSQLDDGNTGLSPEFEALRWFPLPPGCLSQEPAAASAAPTG